MKSFNISIQTGMKWLSCIGGCRTL